MTLPMAPGVYETFVVDGVCSTTTFRDDMIRFYAFARKKWDTTQSASVSLLLVQGQPLLFVGFPSHLPLFALVPVRVQRWVEGRISPFDFDEAGDRGFVGLDQFRLPFLERPIAVVPEVASFHPFPAFVRVSALRPVPEHLPLGMSDFLEGSTGCTVPVVVRPSPYDRVEVSNHLHRRGLLVRVQTGTYRPQMSEDFFLLWRGQQFSLFPEFPDVKPQEVKPVVDVYHPGFRFTERQSSISNHTRPEPKGLRASPQIPYAHTAVKQRISILGKLLCLESFLMLSSCRREQCPLESQHS
jgi:hypothetical protein